MDNQNIGYAYHLPTGGFLLKCRNVLSQFSDLFSEFNKYIAPAYHHDRCERSVQMRLYSMHKREFVMVFLGFYVCFGLAVFIGLAGPPITITTSFKGTEILHKQNSSGEIYSGPFIITSPAMTTYNQQLWVIAVVKTQNADEDILDKSFHVSVAIDALTAEHKSITILHSDKAHNRTHHLRCQGQLCEQVTILHIEFLDYTHYILKINFYGLETFNQHYNIKEVTFYFKSYNPGFTQIEIWFRFIFLLATFCISCWFAHTLRKFPIFDWSIEQKWMSFMLPLLLLYNNPIFPLTFLVNSWIPGMFDALFQASFLSGLLLFWICIYHGLSTQHYESVSQSLRGWTLRAGTYVVEKMAFFERITDDGKGISFIDRYLRAPSDGKHSEELIATTTTLAGEDECETSGGTSGEEIWGTPTSGDSGLTSPNTEYADTVGTPLDDAREQLMFDRLLSGVSIMGSLVPLCPVTRGFPQRRRLDPLPEDEEDTSESTSLGGNSVDDDDEDEATKSYSTDQGNKSDSCAPKAKSASSTPHRFFSRLKLRRSQSADSKTSKPNKFMEFLRGSKSEEHTSSSTGSKLTRLFSRESQDDIPTSLPPDHIHKREHFKDKNLERRFWKQLRKRRSSNDMSSSSKSAVSNT